MLGQLSRDIKTRLDALIGEADKLRQALTALGSRDGNPKPSTPTRSSAAQTRSPRRAQATATAAAPPRQTSRSKAKPPMPSSSRQTKPRSTKPSGQAREGTRTVPGATRRAVVETLADGTAMTAGEIAAATGLGRPSVSTTLSRLAKTGELTKAARGYQIAQTANQATTDTSPDPTTP